VSDSFEVPGPESQRLCDLLARHECPGITARRARQGEARGLGRDPIVWARAEGAHVWDVDGNRYLDLTGAFGVALAGHAHPSVVAAVQQQAATLLHGMGDVYPNRPRIELMARLAGLAPAGLTQCILATGGAEAVEVALKTAALASGRPGVVAFWGSYHGLSYGTLAATAYKADFRTPFRAQLGGHVVHLPYGEDPARIAALLDGPATGGEHLGAVLVEPILGRGGVVEPPSGWLGRLREITAARGVLLILDEIYTGLGRTGRWWASEHEGVVPDILCAGKALGGGMPVSACLARPEVMAAWGMSKGEAIHTSTFLGHPVAAAAALANLEVLAAIDAPARARALETRVRARLGERVRGKGAFLGVRVASAETAARVTGRLLRAGVLVLPGGVQGDVLTLTPPLTLAGDPLEEALDAVARALEIEER
jgi:4-aminobutyrate aminotransferase-like enzyme